MKVKGILHGECMAFHSILPKNAKIVNTHNSKYRIVADSEVTGNHHVVDLHKGVELFENDEGTLFMKNSSPTQIRCLLKERHDNVILEPNTWEFGIQQEYDHISDELISVRD